VGLAPAALFLTGAMMWWDRVLKPWLRPKTDAPSRRPEVDEAHSENSVGARS